MSTTGQAPDTEDTKSYEHIPFEDLVLHTLLDMFEFSAHSFQGLSGPYFWNGIGIDFESPMPKAEVLEHALSANAHTIYVRHTHPLSNDSTLAFLHAKVDPREQIAFGYRPLPLGNGPSAGDIAFLSQVKAEYAEKDIQVIGLVFSASGIWEYDIADRAQYNTDSFLKAHDALIQIDSEGFMDEWLARMEFPSYYMELQKPKMHSTQYHTQLSKVQASPNPALTYKDAPSKMMQLFSEHGITVKFHPYAEFGIEPQVLMRDTLGRWAKKFNRT